MHQFHTEPRFQLGRLRVTPAASAALDAAGIHPIALLVRHVHGDWGDVCEHDRLQNEIAVVAGFRVSSSYPVATANTIWVITEADRSATTVLLTEGY